MDSPRSKFVLSVNRHGFVKTVARSAYTRIRRLIPLEVCGVHVRNSEVHDTPHVEGYVTRRVESYEEFLTKLSPELQGLGNVDEAFTRNDLCIANFYNEQIVGYCFYTQHSTKVEDDVAFLVPAHHVYIYMAPTATTHRSRRHGLITHLPWSNKRRAAKRHYRFQPSIPSEVEYDRRVLPL